MLEINSYAKINLYLEIKGKRNDGYHDLDMIMQSVDLCDHMIMERAKDFDMIVLNGELPEDNSIRLAAAEFFKVSGIKDGAKIIIYKYIPLQAGLGGASTNAAAALRGLNELYGFPLSDQTLFWISGKIGSDVPFCLTGGCCRAQGTGDILTPIENNLDAYYLLLKPKTGIDTKEAYFQYHRHEIPAGLDIEAAMKAMEDGDYAALKKATGNSLLRAAIHCCPEVAAIMQTLENAGTPAYVMTGSGSTCVGIFKTEKDATRMQQQLLNWDLELNRIVRAI